MQRLINPLLLILVSFIVGCTSANKTNHKKYLAYLNDTNNYLPNDYFEKLKKSSCSYNVDSIRANTSDFYDIEIVSIPNMKVFNLEEKKFFSMQITNYGDKEMFLPEWFRIYDKNYNKNNVEMTIDIYKKRKNKYEKYIQKSMTTQTFVNGAINPQKRVVFNSNKGKHVSYENISIDLYKKIVDNGFYKAKIYIDLSSFGYFKTLETEIFFEVKQ